MGLHLYGQWEGLHFLSKAINSQLTWVTIPMILYKEYGFGLTC